jgi:CubicO group peptidase (beta-lactamase class C family)
MSRAVLAVLLVAGATTAAHAQPPRWSEAAAIDAVAREAIAAGRLPGCVVVIGTRDAVLWRRAYGQRALLPAPAPMLEDTVFDLASLSKAVATTIAAMILVERGTIRLDDPVSRFIPEFTGRGRERITLWHLLTHTSGIRSVNRLRDYEAGPEAGLRAVLAERPRGRPGTRYDYSDLGFIVLGEVIRRASGQDLATFVRENVYAPLQMSETGYLPAEALRARAAPTEQRMRPDGTREEQYIQGLVHDPRAFRLGGVAGNAGVFSTAADMTRFAQAMLGRGALGPARILREETFDAMLVEQPVPAAGTTRRALGWMLQERGGPLHARAYGHAGWTGTSLWIDPSRDLFVLFLSNRVHPDGRGDHSGLARRIAQIAAQRVDREGSRAAVGSTTSPSPSPSTTTTTTTSTTTSTSTSTSGYAGGVDGMTAMVLYAVACVVAPAVWGVAMYYVFGWMRRRLERGGGKDRVPPVDYSI